MTDVVRRRLWLGSLALAVGGPARAQPQSTLVAAWREWTEARNDERVGLLHAEGSQLRVGASLPVPSRAHGLHRERNGSVLVVARRPGDWLLRWHPPGGHAQWHWLDDDHRLNGHLAIQLHGGQLLTTETDRATGNGALGVRDAATLRTLDHWPTHGLDPHQVLVLPAAVGRWPAGTVLVANGGIPTRSETGRQAERFRAMDASLVALDSRHGALLAQWRLADERLSIRHLAWNPRSRRVGVALQAEHDDPQARASAPVLAVWDGDRLATAPASSPASPPSPPSLALAGYGGDVVASADGGFIVSCPRAHAVAAFSPAGVLLRVFGLHEACALAVEGNALWAGGQSMALRVQHHTAPVSVIETGRTGAATPAVHLDNHWLAWLTDPRD